jgi:hypothetical protein
MTVERRATWILGALVAFRVALPLAVLAASGHKLAPGFPRYVYEPLPGDAYGFYSAARAILAEGREHAPLVLAVALAAVAAIVWAWRARRRLSRPAVAVVVAWAVGAVTFTLAALVPETGAAVIGWPLLWSFPMLPYRLPGLPLDPDIAYGFGLVLSLSAVGTTVVATYALGRAITSSVRIGLLGAALIAFWPILVLVLGGHRGTENGTWQHELGLSLYTEPISTALVAVAIALVVWPPGRNGAAAVAGALLGFAVAVRLSNILILVCVLVTLALRRRSRAVWAAVTALAFAPTVLVFYPKGYAALSPPIFPEHPFELRYARHAWTDSLLWRPGVLAILLVPAAVGTLRATRWAGALLWSCILSTAALYTLYQLTPLHPRFLFVVLPLVLVLWAAGAAFVAELPRRRTTIGAA